MLDANLTEEALAFLAKNVRAPLFADAVSAAKAPRLRGVLSHLKGFKPNRLEAEALTGRKINDIAGARRAARALLDAGVERVFITLARRACLPPTKGASLPARLRPCA